MDGFKKRLRDSLQLRLSLWISLAIFSTAAIAGAFAFISAFQEAHELQDDVLRQVAALFKQSQLNIAKESEAQKLADSDGDSRVFVEILPEEAGQPLRGTPRVLALPAVLHEGLQTVDADGESFRVLVKTMPSGDRFAFAQQTEVRDEIARGSALRALAPFPLLVPILLLLVAHLVRNMFRPIAVLSSEIDQRAENELHPLDTEPLPSEVRPFVIAINRLLERVSQAMETQRRFVSDAAHELRSPLTAMSLQAESLAGADLPASARSRLTILRQGIERGRLLLEQLLALARAQSSGSAPFTAVSVQQVYKQVLEDLMPLAEAKAINIGVASDVDVVLHANEVDVITLIKNLVENAIRYSPRGGRVDLSVHVNEEWILLQVDDSGPGIAPDQRERVFNPFYRAPGHQAGGSGLGLAIVRTIAERLGAAVRFAYCNEETRSGLRVMVLFQDARRYTKYKQERIAQV